MRIDRLARASTLSSRLLIIALVGLMTSPALADDGTTDAPGPVTRTGADATPAYRLTTSLGSEATKTKRRRRRRANPSDPAGWVNEKLLARGSIGLNVGFSSANFECDCYGVRGNEDYDRVTGLVAGLSYDKSVNRFLGYRLSALYHQKGADWNDGGRGYEVILTTGEIAASGIIRYSMSNVTTLYLNLGVYVGAIFDTEATISNEKSRELADQFSFLDYGLNIGAGAFFALSRSRGLMASAQLLYSHGLADLFNHDEVAGLDADDQLLSRAYLVTGAVHF